MYEVIKDTNTSSELLGTFENLKEAKKMAEQEIINTNPDNENEGINIYNENGMIISYFGKDVTIH